MIATAHSHDAEMERRQADHDAQRQPESVE
jgi:adenosyl cobinamide kinase/adenosyl cobinamide phosphate guanylyltransferase